MRKNILIVITFMGLFHLIIGHAIQMQLEVIPLKYRTADEIITIIKPLVTEGGTVTGMNNQLIVKTTPENLVEIKQLLQNIDKAARRLMITVRQGISGKDNLNEQSISADISTDNVNITSSGGQRGTKGTEVVIGDGDDAIRYRTRNTRSDVDDENDFQIQTVEGQPAYIETGQSVPISNQNTFVTQDGVIVQDTIEYHDVTSGFYVIPQLHGNHVTLQVSPQLNRVNPHHGGVFDVQNITTTVSGQLGEWIHIGAIDRSFNDNNKGILYSTQREGQESRSIVIKVEEIQ